MKKILFCLLSVLAFVACSDDFMSYGNGENLVFTATIDNPQTRTSIARETGKVSWVEGDVILINGVEYVAHPDGDNAATATFTKRDENAANPVKNREGNYVASYGDVENQTYSPDGANCPMTATSDNTNLSFANDCGVLRINANANGVEVSSVKVDNYILGCPDGVDITEAKDFYVALPAGTYNNLEIVFTGNGRNISTKVYNGELTIERNHIYPITFTEPLQFVDPLPGDYTEVNAIISSGTQYINTGVAPVSNTRVVLKDFIAYSTNIEWPVFFGVTNNDGGNTTWMFRRNSNKNSICSAIGSITSPYYNYIHENYTEGTRIEEVSLDRKNGLLINGVQAEKSAIDNDPVFASEPMYLFGGNNNGAFWRGSRMSISACKIYEGHNLVRDYVAVFRNSDSKPGLYDLVTKQFFTNQGTGEFSYTDPSMPEYSELEYIQSNRNQYINTGVVPAENTKVVLKDFCCLSYNTWDVCYGVTNDDGGANSWMMRIDGGNKHDLTSAIGNIKTSPYYNYRCSYTLGATVEEVSLDHQNGLSINGVQGTASAINNTPVYSRMPIFLFGGNQDGKFWRGSHMRIHGCQIYEGNTLVRDFVAMRRNADNVVGLYDRVEDKFYINNGSGTFETGPVVQDSNPETTGSAPVLESAGRPNNECGWVQLWENGPKFATMFVGSTEADFSNCTSYSVAYCGGMYGWDSNTATTVWGANWTVATLADYRQMYAGFNTSSEKNMQLSPSIPNEGTNCIWEWMDGTAKQYVTGCTIQGWKVSGKGAYAANSIFFPLSGCNGDSRVGSIGVYYTATNGNRLYFDNSGTSIDMQVYAGDRYHMLAKLVESNTGPAPVGLVGSAPVTVSDNVNANARTSCGWVLLWDGGPRWAEFNVGASATTYAGMTEYSFANTGGLYSFQGKRNLYPDVCGAISGDTATELWGTNWRTPTSAEEQALLRNCDFTYCDGSTVQYVTGCTLKGWKVTGRGGYAGNSIFLPLAGVSDQNSGNGVPRYYNDSQRPGNGGWYWAVDGNNRIYLNTTSQSIASHDSPHGCSVRAVLAE